MFDFLKPQFDKLLLALLLVLSGGLVLHLIHHNADKDNLAQAWSILSTLLGSLITIITGRLFQQRKSDNGNGQGNGHGTSEPSTVQPEAKP